jgi:hypothetical protein
MHIDHDHNHEHAHAHTHEHTHDGHTHSHEHVHAHTHSHEHPHTHDHLHEQGHEHHHHHHDHEHHHEHTHAPMDELLALMKYMVGHNAAHAKELADLAVKLDEAGSHASYHKVMDAVACFDQGNGMLAEVLKELGAE